MNAMKEGDYFVAVCGQCGNSFRKVLINGKYLPRERDMTTPHVHGKAKAPTGNGKEQTPEKRDVLPPEKTYEEKLKEIEKEAAEFNHSLANPNWVPVASTVSGE